MIGLLNQEDLQNIKYLINKELKDMRVVLASAIKLSNKPIASIAQDSVKTQEALLAKIDRALLNS